MLSRFKSITKGLVEFFKVKKLPLEGNARLHVAAVYFNHKHYRNLYTNFVRFIEQMEQAGVTLHVVEVVLNDNEFEVTDSSNPHHVQLRTKYEMFHKENLCNIAFRNAIKLYGDDVKYLAWIDTDVHFINENFVADTIDELNRHKVVQMWSKAIDLDPDGNPIVFANNQSVVSGFIYDYLNKGLQPTTCNPYGTGMHPGYAWAIRRSTFEEMGGLYDISVLGAGDHHMAWAFIGTAHKGIHGEASEGYKKASLDLLYKIKHTVNADVGYVDGTVFHYWHGTKASRFYVDRWKILVDSNFDPTKDLIRYPNGMLEITGENKELRDGIRRYFSIRNDDCNVTSDFFKQKL